MSGATLLAILLVLFSCEDSNLKNPAEKLHYDFDFSYDSGWGVSYSLKFTNSAMLFLGNGWVTKKYFFGTLNFLHRQKLDSFIIALTKQKWDPVYAEDQAEDQHSYPFYLRTDTSLIRIFVYGDTAPIELQNFSQWLDNLKEKVNFLPTDTAINFGSTHNFYPPILPPSKITPP